MFDAQKLAGLVGFGQHCRFAVPWEMEFTKGQANSHRAEGWDGHGARDLLEVLHSNELNHVTGRKHWNWTRVEVMQWALDASTDPPESTQGQ